MQEGRKIIELGEQVQNNKGTSMKIVDIKNNANITVEFQDEHKYISHTTYSNFKRGQVKNPYDITVYGFGYIGVGKHPVSINKKDTPTYLVWKNMIDRCYYKPRSNKFKAYYHISTIDEEWRCFQSFAEWYETNKYEVEGRLHLDKDILFPGNKVYSPDTCLLVPQRINMLFLNIPNKKGLPNGISLAKTGYRAMYNSENLGIYPTLEMAYSVYAKRKEEEIKKVAEEYKNIIPEKVFTTLMNYKVKIEIDKNYKAS